MRLVKRLANSILTYVPNMIHICPNIMDSKMEGIYDKGKMEILVEMALQCLKEDKDERPTMKQVVEKLLHLENDCSRKIICKRTES